MISSYSYLGNIWEGANRTLLTGVLRNEWGLQGTVVTGSVMGNTGWMDINLALRAGGDMMLCLMGVKIGIVAVLAAVLALIFWACFFRSVGMAVADPNAS